MFTDKTENSESDITELLTTGEVEINSVKYNYSYEDKVEGADRAFAYQTEFDESSHLFELVPKEGEMKAFKGILESLDMQDPNVYESLIMVGRDLVDRVEKEIPTTETPLNFFEKEIELNGRKFGVKYASPIIKVGDMSLRQYYEKRLRRRIVV